MLVQGSGHVIAVYGEGCATLAGVSDASVHVIGASGRSGATLCRALAAASITVVPVVRDAAKWASVGIDATPRVADLADAPSLRAALGDATRVVSCAHARFAPSVLAAARPNARFIFLGSTRKFTLWPDAHGAGVLAGEAAFLGSGRAGVMLHPTMIYGATGEDNVQRLAALLRRLPLVPLPGGGRALVQPIHQDDVTRCILAALAVTWDGPHSLVVAGPTPLPYADFVRAVARAAGLPPPRILGIPAGPLMAAAAISAALPLRLKVRPAEIRRLLEDKAFDIAPMIATLGVRPISLDDGLLRTFRRVDLDQ
jgi:nucleoside-diphosphate-sugar epimerase